MVRIRPYFGKFAMNKNEFQIAAFLRIGQAIAFNYCVTHCDCGREMDADGYYLLTCKLGGGPVWEHNNLVAEWCQCLRDLQLHHNKEPKNQYTVGPQRYEHQTTELTGQPNSML